MCPPPPWRGHDKHTEWPEAVSNPALSTVEGDRPEAVSKSAGLARSARATPDDRRKKMYQKVSLAFESSSGA